MSNDRYEKIRKALAMRPTPGPWLFCPTNSGTFVKSERVPGYLAEVRHCRTTQDVKADAHLIAACDPDTIRELLDERDALAAEVERLHEQLLLATVDQATADAEANDAHAENKRLAKENINDASTHRY